MKSGLYYELDLDYLFTLTIKDDKITFDNDVHEFSVLIELFEPMFNRFCKYIY